MEKLKVFAPRKYKQEIEYICRVVFFEFLGLDFELLDSEENEIIVTLGNSNKTLKVKANLFSLPEKDWCSLSSLPKIPLEKWNVKNDLPEALVCEDSIPVIYGQKLQNRNYIRQDDTGITLGLDIFGSVFFMLTRYEEYVIKARDIHDRFPASESLALKEGFLLRPIVNEYVEVLWAAMNRLWPGLKRNEKMYRVIPTHDIDSPAIAYKSPWKRVVKGAAGDILKRKSLSIMFKRIQAKLGKFDVDPAYTFDFILKTSEKHGLISEFYFMTGHSHPRFDTFYNLNGEHVIEALKMIYQRGHRIGLHASYNTYKDLDRMKIEFERLVLKMNKLGIKQDKIGNRQHFLRFEVPTTWRVLDQVGVDYDSTMTFAQHVGFRTGTCYEYTVYDLEQRKPLKIKEKPLMVMDGTLLDEKYMNLGYEEALNYIKILANRVKMFNGDFVLLWHNTMLITDGQKRFYEKVLDTAMSV
uniref:DUF7033 domain-containing protein n=1 Tax=candidate division WOR-3 bacterium TaxID=2052148 RepID=A0A7C2K256_UNCW3